MRKHVHVSFLLAALLFLESHGFALTVGPAVALPEGFNGVTAEPLQYEATVYNLCSESIWVSTVESYQYTCSAENCPPSSFATRGWWEIPPRHERVFDFSRSRYIEGTLFFYIEDSSGFNVAPYSMASVKSCVSNEGLDLKANEKPSLCAKNATYFRPLAANVIISQCY
jgi:hypothetical protein